MGALGALGAQLVREHHAFDPGRFLAPGDRVEEAYSQFLERQVARRDAIILVAELDGEVVGYVYAGIEPVSWLELRDQVGYIHDLAVADHARGRGVGAGLVDAAVAWLGERGMPRVLLWTAPQNETARRLFAKAGFRPTMIEMTKELGPSGQAARRSTIG